MRFDELCRSASQSGGLCPGYYRLGLSILSEEGATRMNGEFAYIIEPGADQDDRSVRIDFEPEIDVQYLSKVLGHGRDGPQSEDDWAQMPKRVRVTKPRRGGIPWIFEKSNGPFVVHSRVRQILEELEPDVHRFHPLEAIEDDDGASIGTYHLILPPPRLDCFDMARTDWQNGNVGFIDPIGRIILKGTEIDGHHFWRGPNMYPLMYDALCSDTLPKKLDAEGIKDLNYFKTCLVMGAASTA